jgi:hypothetical protein
MSNHAAASNVIPMRELERPVSSQQAASFERLLKECRDRALARLMQSVSAMLDKAPDTLWGLANQTPDRETRDLYVAAKDKATLERSRIESEFRANYLAEFERRARRDKKPQEQFSQFDLSSLELDLVNDDDLEETLKVNDMAGKLRRYCDEELAALDQRVGVLVGDANLQGEANPFSPQAICNAFKQTCRSIEPASKVRMLLHKLFDDHVLDDIRPIFKDLNSLLVEHSILPKIRYAMARRAAAGAIGSPAESALGVPAAATLAAAAQAAPLAAGFETAATSGGEDVFAMLQNLVAMKLGSGLAGAPVAGAPAGGGALTQIPGFPPIPEGTGAPGGAAGPVRLLQGRELLGSLTRIQHGDVSAIGGANLPLAATLLEPGIINVLRELKATSLASGLAQIDSVTLDIVAMLFDQIFGDEKIPAAMKALIGRLQIPMLKVAILDKTFFSNKTHPARRLLDTLGEIALGLNADFDQASPLFKKIHAVIQKLVDSFQEGMDIFDALRQDLDGFMAEEARRAEQEAKVAARRLEHMEKLQLGKTVAQQEILHRAKSGSIPRAVLRFLVEEWLKLLLVVHAKHGPDSDAWKSVLETMDLLIWSVNAKHTLEERRRLAGILPGLLKRLSAGMQLVQTDDDTRKRFFAKLMRCHTKVMNVALAAAAPAAATVAARAQPSAPQPPVLTQVPLPAAAPLSEPLLLTEALALEPPARQHAAEPAAAGNSEPVSSAAGPAVDEDTEPAAAPPEFCPVVIRNPFGEGEIEVEEISLSDLPPGPDLAAEASDAARIGGDDHGQLAARLEEGTWVEFRDDEDNTRQARLAYISPLKGTYLFVNKQGKRVGEYSLYQLMREFRSGRASIVDAVPLFERAMGGLVGALRASTAAH